MVAKGKDLKKGMTSKKHKEMVKRVEGFKRLVSAIAKFVMAISMLLTMALYIYNIIQLHKGQFFIARTR